MKTMIRPFIACFLGLVLIASSLELYCADHFFLLTLLSWTNNSTHEQKPTTTKESAVPWLDPMRHNRSYVFVHLGKAGGSTVAHATTTLQGACRQMANKARRQACLDGIANQTRHEMVISQTGRIVTSLHAAEQKKVYNMPTAGAFLWPIRDPMDRFVSAFYLLERNSITSCTNKSKRSFLKVVVLSPTMEDLKPVIFLRVVDSR